MIVDHPLCFAIPLTSMHLSLSIGSSLPRNTQNSLTPTLFDIYPALPWRFRAFAALLLDVYASNACSLRTPLQALPFTPSRPHHLHTYSISAHANAYPSEFTTSTPIPLLMTEMTSWLFFFLLRNLTFLSTLCLSIYVSCSLLFCYRITSFALAILSKYPRFFYIPKIFVYDLFFLLDYCSPWSQLDLDLIFLMFCPHFTSSFLIYTYITWIVGWQPLICIYL
jgi:hypothetical protein